MLYNLYRPKDFTEVKGQEDVLITLKKQSSSQKFGHAYLFAGHRGTGKTTIARILSKAVNCEHPTEDGPCGQCPNCLAYGTSLDVLELDAASNNGVDKIKEMLAQTKYRPVRLKRKVFIIDEVHNLSTAAFDTLLKPLEEPPSYCVFVLCTTELHKIPVTIRSRCEEYVFHPIAPEPMRERLKEVLKEQNAVCEEDALNLIIRNANGGLRDALGILEQLLTSTDNHITTEAAKKRLGSLDSDHILAALSAISAYDTQSTLSSLDELTGQGKSPALITEAILSALMDIITIKTTGQPESVLHSKDYLQSALEIGNGMSFERLYWLCEQCCDLRGSIRGSVNPAMDIKLALIKMSNHELTDSDPAVMSATIRKLEQELAELKSTVKKLMNAQPADNSNSQAVSQAEGQFHTADQNDVPFETSSGGRQFTDEELYSVYAENYREEEEREGGMQSDRPEAPDGEDIGSSSSTPASVLFKIRP